MTTQIPAEILSRINTVKDYQEAAAKREAKIKAQQEAELTAYCEQGYAKLKETLLKLLPEDIRPYVRFGPTPSKFDVESANFEKRIEIPGLVSITILTKDYASFIHSYRVPVSKLITCWNNAMCEDLANEIVWQRNEKFEELGPALVFAQEQQELLDSYTQQIFDAEKRVAEFVAKREALAEQREAEYEARENERPVKSQDEIERDHIVATIQGSPIGQAFLKAVSMLVNELSELHSDNEY